MIIEEGHDYLLQVLPSWIFSGHVDRIVVDPNGSDFTYAVISTCCWIERIHNHVELLGAKDPAKARGLQCHLYPAPKHIRLSAITQADAMNGLLKASVGGR